MTQLVLSFADCLPTHTHTYTHSARARRDPRRFCWLVVFACFAFLVTAFCLFLVDTWYYGRAVLTPLNSFLYNTRTSNLAAHGLHGRGTHIFLNFPFLFSPVITVVVLALSCVMAFGCCRASIGLHTQVLSLVLPFFLSGWFVSSHAFCSGRTD